MALAMHRESRALLSALQRGRGLEDVRPLITPETARIPDTFYNLKPLFWALSYGASREVLQLILDADPAAVREAHPEEGWTPLHYAERLDGNALALLLERYPDAAAVQDREGRLPLHWAAEHDVPLSVARPLLQANPAAAFKEDAFGRVPIRLAVDHGASQDLVELLRVANPSGAAAALAASGVAAAALAPSTVMALSLPSPSVASSALPEASEIVAVSSVFSAVAPGAVASNREEPLPVGLMFPDQGSQYVGMLGRVKDLPGVQAMLQEARSILGFDILQVCLEGPSEKLQEPATASAAAFLAGLAALEQLRAENPEVGRRFQAVAGYSLGEIVALCAAGVFSFADGLRLVRARAEGMLEANSTAPQATMTVAGLDEAKVARFCAQAVAETGSKEVCQISGFLFHRGFAVAGTLAAMERCRVLCRQGKALQAKLVQASPDSPVLPALHTPLMAPAADRLQAVLDEMLPRMSTPKCRVFMNVDAAPLDWDTEPRVIVDRLVRQLTTPVRWKDCVAGLIADGALDLYELGPGKQLKAMLKRIDNYAWTRTALVEV